METIREIVLADYAETQFIGSGEEVKLIHIGKFWTGRFTFKGKNLAGTEPIAHIVLKDLVHEDKEIAINVNKDGGQLCEIVNRGGKVEYILPSLNYDNSHSLYQGSSLTASVLEFRLRWEYFNRQSGEIEFCEVNIKPLPEENGMIFSYTTSLPPKTHDSDDWTASPDSDREDPEDGFNLWQWILDRFHQKND